MLTVITNLFDNLGIIPHSLPNAIGLWPNEQECLIWTAAQCDPHLNWLEVGSFCGGSTVLLAMTMENLHGNGNIIACDNNFNPMFDLNIRRSNVGNVKKLKCDSKNLLKWYNDPISFAFLDGWHSFSSIIKEFEIISGLLCDDGIIAFHDVSPKMLKHDQEHIDQCYQYVKQNWNNLMNNKDEDFRIDEAISLICKDFGYEIIEIPVRSDIKHFQETRLNCWVRGKTSPYNALTAIRKIK